MTGRPLLLVDAANVIGSVPDGWWRDRAAAVRRLRDALVPAAVDGLPVVTGGGLDVVLVVEGAASGVPSIPQVQVVAAPADADATIVDLVRARAGHRDCVVVTADRQLRARVIELGASVLGPRSVWPRRP